MPGLAGGHVRISQPIGTLLTSLWAIPWRTCRAGLASAASIYEELCLRYCRACLPPAGAVPGRWPAGVAPPPQPCQQPHVWCQQLLGPPPAAASTAPFDTLSIIMLKGVKVTIGCVVLDKLDLTPAQCMHVSNGNTSSARCGCPNKTYCLDFPPQPSLGGGVWCSAWHILAESPTA